MEPALILKTATALLALGALGGLVMAGMPQRRSECRRLRLAR
jgi:hypothetical protein